MHKAGFIAIVGKPNAGKSTLMNRLIGQELSIVTPKAQTTRHRIRGIVSTNDHQIIFSDTPGLIHPNYKLHKRMMDFVGGALADADAILLVMDVEDSNFDVERFKQINAANKKVIVALNKIDLVNQEELEKRVNDINATLAPAEIVPISAKEKFGADMLLKAMVKYLPEAPAFFDKETLTDRNERFFVSEIIREKIFLQFEKEIPYSTEVSVEEFKEKKEIVAIRAYIFAERESQKAILLGKNGSAIKKLGMDSRKKIEEMLQKKVYLELTIKIRDGWRDDENMLNNFGYKE